MRDIQSPTGLHYRIHETPEDLAVLTPRVAQEPEIWIDTETADWNAKSPRLSTGASISKWAHYARFERRILGADFVQGLHCTFELARRVPYHRLPLRSLRLAALVHHLCGTAVDKTLQRADWGQRPLSAEQLDYAAWGLLTPARRARRQPLAHGHVGRDQGVHGVRLARALRGLSYQHRRLK